MFRLCLLVLLIASHSFAQELTHVRRDATTRSSEAVIVPPSALLHTATLLPSGDSVDVQVASLVRSLNGILKSAGGTGRDLVKLNISIAREELADEVRSSLAKHLPAEAAPARMFVTTPLPRNALVALDAVAAIASPAQPDTMPNVSTTGTVAYRILPKGGRVSISGQAERSEDIREATRLTLESLRKTLREFDLDDASTIQLKSFLNSMADWPIVVEEVEKLFPKARLPALVFVEWKSSKDVPIEIELIAGMGREEADAPEVIEFLAPSHLKPSPIYSRLTRVRFGPSIYIEGRIASTKRDGKGEVLDIFESLKPLLAECGTDFQYLAKATYYVSGNESSAALNELRPRYYDPKRPPSASKAMVAGVAAKDRTISLDLIAVPTKK